MRAVAIAVFVLQLLASGIAVGQSPIAPPASGSGDVEFRVRTRGGQTTFHIGEVVPLELAFSSASTGKYQLDTAGYDRSGRLNEEHFIVEPGTGWADPLYRHFHGYQGFIGGGLRGFETLSNQPRLVSIELNELVRFDQPGRYRVTVSSDRVSPTSAPMGTGQIRVRSNDLLLTIVAASQQWQQQTLASALAALDAVKPDAHQVSQGDPGRAAAKTIRYLGTATAAREMVSRLNNENWSYEFRFGLEGSPAREPALQAMADALNAPSYPVTGEFLSTMSVVALPEDNGGDLAAEREQFETRFRQDLVGALSNKQGGALAVSTQTIIEEAAIYSHPLPPDVKYKLTQQLISSFDQLPVSKQAELLQYRWEATDHQAMLPLVRKAAQRYQDFPELRDMNAYAYNNVSAAALDHWYELDPAGARPAILQEIMRPKPRFDAKVLGVLPDEELPEADQALVEHLRASHNYEISGNIASLIHRYVSAAVEGAVTEQLDPRLGKMECAVQQPLLAYLVRVSPETARPRLEAAMAARGEGFSACNRSLLVEVGNLQNNPILEELAIRSLDDPDPSVAGNAADYLGKYGTPPSEDILWAHLVDWSQRWKGHEEELRSAATNPTDGVYQAGEGTNLMMALAAGQGWLTNETKLLRLIQLGVTTDQRQQAERYLSTWNTRPFEVRYTPIGKGQLDIAQYHASSIKDARQKLLQFPSGTRFKWLGDNEQEQERRAFDELFQTAAAHGMVIERAAQ